MKSSNFNEMKKRAMQNFRNVSAVAAGILPGVKWTDLADIACKCGKTQFTQSCGIKLASPLQSTKSIPTVVQLPVGFMCTSCNAVNDFDEETMKKVMPKGQKPVGSMKDNEA